MQKNIIAIKKIPVATWDYKNRFLYLRYLLSATLAEFSVELEHKQSYSANVRQKKDCFHETSFSKG